MLFTSVTNEIIPIIYPLIFILAIYYN